MDIIMIGLAGASGTAKIAKYKNKELAEKYPGWFLENAINIGNCNLPGDFSPEVHFPVMVSCGEGGVMTALWKLGKVRKKGFVADILKIPVRQETIELCENYQLDPYRLESENAYIFVSENGQKDLEWLRSLLDGDEAGKDGDSGADKSQNGDFQDFEAAIIGYTTENNDKIILFDIDKEKRFLDRPREDELFKVLEKGEKYAEH